MKNTVSSLPLETKDIKSRVNRNYAVGAAVTILWCAAVLAVINTFDLSSDHIRIVSAAALVATIAIPVRLLRPHRLMLDRDWTGVVKKVVRANRPQSALIGFLERTACASCAGISTTRKTQNAATARARFWTEPRQKQKKQTKTAPADKKTVCGRFFAIFFIFFHNPPNF